MPRSSEQNERLRAERRDRILRAARLRFAANGLTATRIADIAAAAGMAQGLLYHYFPTKEDLFAAVVADAFDRLRAATDGLEALSWAPAKKIASALAALVHSLATDDAFAPTILLIAQASLSDATPEPTRALMRRERDHPYAAMARIFAAGQRDGSVPPGDPADLAVAFWALIKGLALHKAAWGPDFRPPDLATLGRPFLTSPAPAGP